MNKEDLLPYIETDINQFWENTININNTDSLLFKLKITTPKNAIKFLSRPENYYVLRMCNNLFKNYYLIKGEYLIGCGGVSLVTNKRLYIFDDKELSIPLNMVIFYGDENGQPVIKYQIPSGERKYFPIKSTLINAIVNNHLETYKDSNDLNNEVIQKAISVTKGGISTLGVELIGNRVDEYKFKPKPNYKALVGICLVLLFVGGCLYMVQKSSNSSSNGTTNTNPAYDSNGKKKKKCPWCGGIGRVGYAGESKAQVEKTQMGLGNECTTCNGTGYVDDDK